jgi:hypothetical protein
MQADQNVRFMGTSRGAERRPERTMCEADAGKEPLTVG